VKRGEWKQKQKLYAVIGWRRGPLPGVKCRQVSYTFFLYLVVLLTTFNIYKHSYMKSFTAKCFGSAIKSHHLTDKVLEMIPFL